MKNTYKTLSEQRFIKGNYSIVPLRLEDRYDIMKWRNEQIYHLRQSKPLNKEDQDKYFNDIISNLFKQEQPGQILFSYLDGDLCIGYGGLVHICWFDRNAEISFIMNTALEVKSFEFHWTTFLSLIEKVAFNEIGLYKIFTFAYNLRPKIYNALNKENFVKEAVLKNHGYFNGQYCDVIVHSKFLNSLLIRDAKSFDTELTHKWATNSIIIKYAFDKEHIEWLNHKIWFSNKIEDINCEYYILIDNGHNIGSIRFDIDSEFNAMISYLIDPLFHSQGYGKIILEKGIERLKEKKQGVNRVFGFVQKENIPSIKVFKKLGFRKESENLSVCRFEKVIRK